MVFALAMKTQRPWMTWALAASFCAMFLLELYFGSGDASASLGRLGALNGRWVREGQVWELLASAFLHLNVIHLVMNTIALISLAPMIEVLLGPKRLLFAFVGSALLGGALAAIPTAQVMVGASGGIWGLMTLIAVLVLRRNPIVPASVAAAMRPRVGRALVLNGAISLIPGISLLGHLGGGIGGALLGLSGVLFVGVRPLWEREKKAPPSWLTPLAAGVAGLVAISLGAAIVTGRPWELLRPPVLERVSLSGGTVSLSVPREVSVRRESQEGAGSHSWLFGDLTKDGLLVAVNETKFDGLPTGAEMEDLLDQIKASPLMTAPQGYTVESIERLTGERSGVDLRATAPSGARYRKFVSFTAGARIVVEILTHDAAPAWAGVDQRIFASLQTHGSG